MRDGAVRRDVIDARDAGYNAGYAAGLSAGAAQALKDALTLAENRRDNGKLLGYKEAFVDGCDEVRVFIAAELERAQKGTRIPGSPGGKSSVGWGEEDTPPPAAPTEAGAETTEQRIHKLLGYTPPPEQPAPAPAEHTAEDEMVEFDSPYTAPADQGLSEETIAAWVADAQEHIDYNERVAPTADIEGTKTLALRIALLAAEVRRLRKAGTR